MFCTKCGFELPEGTVFCTSCGARQEPAAVESENLQNDGTNKQTIMPKWNVKKGKPAASGESLPGEKKKRGKMIGACVAVIAIIAGTVVLNQPKIKLMRSAYKTYRDITKTESEIGKYLGLEDIMKEIQKGKTHQELTVSGKQDGERLGLRTVLNMDQKNGEMGASVYPMYKNSELTELLLYRNQERTVMAVPDLYDGSFYVNNEDVMKKFRESALNSYIEQWTGKHGGEDSLSDEDRKELQDIGNRFMDQSSETWKQMGKNMTVEKKNSKSFTIGGKSKKCAGYEVTIPKKDMKNVLKEVTRFVEKDNSVKKLFTSLPRMGEAEFERFLNEVEEAVSEMESCLEEDLVLILYTGPKGRLVSMEGEYEFVFSHYEVSTALTASLLGAGNPLDVVELEFDSSDTSAVRIYGYMEPFRHTFTILREQDYNKSSKQLEDSGEFTAKTIRNGNVYTNKLSYGLNFNEKSGAWELSLKADDDTIRAEGTFSDVRKGKGFTFVMDKLKYDSKYGYNTPTFEGQYVVGALGQEPVNRIPADLGDEIDLFDMGMSEIQKIEKHAIEKLTAKLAKVGLEKLADDVWGSSGVAETTAAPATTAAETATETAAETDAAQYSY